MSVIRTTHRCIVLLAMTLALMTPARPARALTGATLVDAELQAQPVKLASLQGGTLSYFDDDRRLQQRPASEFVMLRSIGDDVALSASKGPQPTLVLVDGQRIAGHWLGVTGDGQRLRWSHPVLGEITAPLEDIRGVELSAELPAEQPGDQVVLGNGDALTGFVEGLGDASVQLVPQGSDQAVPLPIERVAALRLANPTEPMPTGVQTVILRDGTRLYAQDLQIGGDQARFDASLPGQAIADVALPLESIQRVELTADGYRLVDVAELPREVLAGGSTFGFARPPRIDGDDVVLHAPVRLAIDLPEGAARFAATAWLDLAGVPADRHDWAACELTVQDPSGAPLADSQHLDAAHGRTELNVPVTGRRLVLELDPSVNGPILDRVRLIDGVVLIKSPRPDGY